MNRDFDKVKELLPEVAVNTTAAGVHMGGMEQHVQIIKRELGLFLQPLL